MTQRHKLRICFWKNGANRLAGHRVATNLQFVKNAVSVKHNEAKCNKTRYAGMPYTYAIYFPSLSSVPSAFTVIYFTSVYVINSLDILLFLP